MPETLPETLPRKTAMTDALSHRPEAQPEVLFVTSNRIGDCVISSGIIAEINRQKPGARITVACGRPPAPFFRSAPGVEEIIILDKKPRGGHWLELWRKVRARRWDMVIDIRGSALAFLLKARERRVYSRALEKGTPKVELVTRLMGADAPVEPAIWLDARAHADAAAVLGHDDVPMLAIAPIALQPGKSWPSDRWGALIEALKREPQMKGWRYQIVGGPGDEAAAADALRAAGSEGINFVGRGDILAAAAALSRARMFVGNDSGLMHTSAALGQPTLGLFGPTEWWLYGPRGPRTETLASNQHGDFAPIESLSVDQVMGAVLAMKAKYGL